MGRDAEGHYRMETIERRAFPVQELRVSRADGGATVDWYPALFDVLSEDLGGFRERIGRRAFTETVAADDIRALFNHDPNFVLGRNKASTLDLRVDVRGLHASVQMPDTQAANDLMVSIERGDVSAGSFAFMVRDEKWSQDPDVGYVREVRAAKLFDVSLVTYPAYTATDGTVGLRALLPALDLNDLVHPLMRQRAGLEIDLAERERFDTVLSELRGAIPAADNGPTADAPWRTFARSRELELLRLRR